MKLADFLLATSPTSQRLNLIHCTTVGAGIEVLARGSLKPASCSVYGEELLYLFYGRPAFKPASGIGASGILDFAPICLVLNPALLEGVRRVLPFDSGGFERYRSFMGPGASAADFELGDDPSLPLRLVKAFYGTNRNYYDQQPTLHERDLPLSRVSARALARLIADPAVRDDDDRCGTIELQYSAAIPLASALQAIVAPAAMLDDDDVVEALALCPDVVLLPYKTYGRFNPVGFANTIYERVDSFLTSRGVFG